LDQLYVNKPGFIETSCLLSRCSIFKIQATLNLRIFWSADWSADRSADFSPQGGLGEFYSSGEQKAKEIEIVDDGFDDQPTLSLLRQTFGML